MQANEPLKMHVLTQLSELTSLELHRTCYSSCKGPDGYAINIPGLRSLELDCLAGPPLVLTCPQLTRLSLS